MFVKVYTDTGKRKPVVLLAQVVHQSGDGIYKIKYLSPTNDLFDGKQVYKFEDDIYEIDDESITEIHVEIPGYTQVDDEVYVKDESDVDYCPSEESDESEDSEYSYENSEEDEDEEEYYQSDYEDDE
jgi:hypothetical protein